MPEPFLHTEVERTYRVAASPEAVWAEVGDLDKLLHHVGAVTHFASTNDGTSGSAMVEVAVGPAKWELEFAVAVIEQVARQRMSIEATCKRLPLRVTMNVGLDSGPNNETMLSGSMVVSGRRYALLMPQIWRLLNPLYEAEIDALCERVKSLAEQHERAAERLRFGPNRE